jgi:predicted secreted protein
VLVAALLGAGCGDRAPAPSRTACDAARRQYCDPTRSIDVRAGQAFTIVFRANSSIGDQWRFEEPVDGAVLRFDGTDFVSDRPDLPGSGHTQIWSFAALAPGTAQVRLGNYYRNGPVTERRVYTVTVQ